MASQNLTASHSRMFDALDPFAFILRLMGAFYVFAGFVAGRAALLSATLDTALARVTMKPVSARERGLTLWLVVSSWLVYASGVLLMVLAQEALWAFILCALTQGLYLTFAAPYYFDVEDPPDAKGRRQTTNAFFIYLGATLIVIWASGRYLTPIAELHPVLGGGAWIALGAFGAFMIWTSISISQLPRVQSNWAASASMDLNGPDDTPAPPKAFDPQMMRLELSRDRGASPVKNQKTRDDIDLDTLAISDSLKIDLIDWMRDGDPEMVGIAYNLAEQLAHELPDVAVAEPGIPNAYFKYVIPSPYADPETGAPNWDRMTAVKIMCDYDCHPVWAADDGVVGNVPPSVLGISGALEDALLSWQERFDASLDPADPARPKWTTEEARAHDREGLDLARRVKAERPEMTIYVHDARGILIADAKTPADRWRAKAD